MAKIRHDLVGVVHPYTADGIPAGFHLSAGDDVPDGIVVGPHLLDGDVPEEPAEPAGDDAPDGRASRDTWAAYADKIGAAYPEDASKADIRAAVEAHTA
ncbi:hypothetical protein [Sanguibacter sp. HDW7]|uniref:hypothetical protein n=1 Tax=Sanguibacter sp. HDW7 TaxID=2714931 RepID=UPI00140C1C84|nr:hypothetical protein [Sanguibacter sp. HDW7]QIK82403.1 hypothetical protein G7063_01325 [Sanguibacter sp. HDW7]